MAEDGKTEQKDQAPAGKQPVADPQPVPSAQGGSPADQSQAVPPASLNENKVVYDERAASQVLRQNEDEHLWRKLYLQKSFYLVGTVLYLTTFIVVLVGVGVIDLSDAVLITMLGTTVAHVVGVLAIAFHWLYPRHG